MIQQIEMICTRLHGQFLGPGPLLLMFVRQNNTRSTPCSLGQSLCYLDNIDAIIHECVPILLRLILPRVRDLHNRLRENQDMKIRFSAEPDPDYEYPQSESNRAYAVPLKSI